jgi:hypothetical protein
MGHHNSVSIAACNCWKSDKFNIRMLGFVIQVIIYILRDHERLRKMQHKVLW